jgi:hypothetical protein
VYEGAELKVHHKPVRRRMSLRRGATAFATAVALLGAALFTGQAGASSPADAGVTSTTIRVGIDVIDFHALESVGVKLNAGNFPDAFNAMTSYMNANGGFDGRKIVPYFVETNPASPTSEDTGCTQLTEDDRVFVVLYAVYPDCYTVTHDTPVISGGLPGAPKAGSAPNFTLAPPDAAYDPVELSAFDRRGVFRGKKVGIFYGPDAQASEVRIVQSELKKLHVDVALTAEDNVVATDTVASDADVQTIALRFKNAGVNLVVGVGGGGATVWPRALLDNQSTYKPPWIATNVTDISSFVESAKGKNPYLDNVMTSTPITSVYQGWQSPAMQKCVSIVKKAYPSDQIDPPPNPDKPQSAANSQDQTYGAVEAACQNLAVFAKIADTAGKNLTVASFTKAGESLRNVTFPGSGPVSFAPGRPCALGKANIYVYDAKTGTLVADPSGPLP